jgi:hypothetical protein
MFVGCSSDVHRMFAGRSPDVRRMFVGCSPDVRRTFAGRSPDVRRTFAGRSPDVLRTLIKRSKVCWVNSAGIVTVKVRSLIDYDEPLTAILSVIYVFTYLIKITTKLPSSGKSVHYIRVGNNPHARASLSPRRNTTPMSYSLFDWETSGREFLFSQARSAPRKLTVSIK